jgi:hypothetical protein
MKVGMQERGVFHGNIFLVTGIPTQTHKGLPTVNFSKQRLEVWFYPYKKMFEEGLASVMVYI